MVMEYLRGKTLAEIIKQRKGKLSEKETLRYVSQIGEALKLLHSSQFLHRDIKPDNIMLADDGRIVLIDFGAARDFTANCTTRYTTMLTPGYAPLEQYGQALKYGAFTDIYALGSTLYHLLTGKAPISAIERAAGVELKTVQEINPHVSTTVSEAIARAMIMDVNERLQSVEEFLNLLNAKSNTVPRKKVSVDFYSKASDPWDVFGQGSVSSTQQSSNINKRWF